MKNNQKSIVSTVAFSLSMLLGILSVVVVCNEPEQLAMKSMTRFILFISFTLCNVILYVIGWIYLILALRGGERLKIIPIIFVSISLINLAYIYLGIELAFQMF